MSKVTKLFKKPPKEYYPLPFGFLNSELSEDEVEWYLSELKDKHVYGLFMHPRTGLIPEYLSEGYWKAMDLLINKVKEKEMKGWIYDEYNWPSGVAGGKLLREYPQYMQKYLDYRVYECMPQRPLEIDVPENTIAVRAVNRDTQDVIDITDKISGKTLRWEPERGVWDVVLFHVGVNTDKYYATCCAPWAKGERGYLDMLSPEAVRSFLNLTHEEYKRRFQEEFGKSIMGVFTDEPANYRGLPWTDSFLVEFKRRKGYDLMERIHELALPVGNYVKTRCDFFEVAAELYAKSYFKQIYDWCEENGLQFTGHLVLEEELDMIPRCHGDVYSALKYMHIPGVDYLGDKTGYDRPLSVSAPNFTPKIASSIAHMMGRGRALCEIFGGCGWETTLCKLKRVVDWIEACGINFLTPHASYMSIKGLRKRDFPASHHVHEPWWKYYDKLADYIARLSYINSSGLHVCDILLLYPMSTLWAEYTLHGKTERWNLVKNSFIILTEALLRIQRDYDVLFEGAVIDDLVKVDGDKLRAGSEEYSVVILPPLTTVHKKLARMLKEFYDNGGKILALGMLPKNSTERMNDPEVIRIMEDIFGRGCYESSTKVANINDRGGKSICIPVTKMDETLVEKVLDESLSELIPRDIQIGVSYDRDFIYTHRKINDRHFFFVVNLSERKVKTTIIFSVTGRPEIWSLEDGSIRPIYVYSAEGGKLKVPYEFDPYESVLFAISPGETRVCITDTNMFITNITETEKGIVIEGYHNEEKPYIVINGKRYELASAKPLSPIELADEWEVEALRPNVLLLEPWTVRFNGKEVKASISRYASFDETWTGLTKVIQLLKVKLDEVSIYEIMELSATISEKMGITLRPVPPGREYVMITEFRVDYIPEDIALVYEDTIGIMEVAINGKKVTAKPKRTFIWDTSNVKVPIREYVKRGRNVISVRGRMSEFPDMIPSLHGIEPMAIIGTFAVIGGRIAEPAKKMRGRSWTEEGYPYYSGEVKYSQRFSLSAEYLKRKLVLEVNSVRDIMEVIINGRKVGVRTWPPFRLDITDYLKEGENLIEIIVSNTAGNLLGKQMPSGIIGRVRIIPYEKCVFALKR